MSEEDIENAPRRRSARIMALAEKREQQKKALEEARKNYPLHYKRKEKAVINGEQVYDFIGHDEYAATKKRRRKSRPLNQLISLTQPIQDGQYTEYSNASRRHGLPRIIPKETLEFVLDLLQRKDPDEVFAQPVNPDQDYHRIVKEPMDFGTMRAKVHENMYTNMENFERDVYLICSNAMNVNPTSTASHKVAEAIKEEASKLFHALSADPQFLEMAYLGPDGRKKSSGRKGHARSKSSGRPRQLPSKHRGGNPGANNSMRAEVDKRQTYCPSGGDSIFSQVLDGPKTNLQFHKSCRHYQDSLVGFVEDLGPAAKKCAARKIETLRQGQIMRGQATRPNPLANFLDTTSGPTSKAAATIRGRNAPHSMNYPVLSSNRPLTIPGFNPHQETRNNINFERSGDYKGKKVVVMDPKENCNAYAASILSGYFMNKNGGGRGSGRGLNFNGEGSSSNSNRPSSFHQNRSSFLTMSPEANQNQNQRFQWNDRPETTNARNNLVNVDTPGNTARNNVATGESTQVEPRVWPSFVISGLKTQIRPNTEPIIYRPAARRPMLSDHSLPSGPTPLSRQSLMRSEQEPTLVWHGNNNISEHSLLPQNLTELDFRLLRQAPWSPRIPTEPVTTGNNFTSQPFMPDQNNKPAMFPNNQNNNLSSSWKSFIVPQQQIPQETMNMTSYDLSDQQPLNSNLMNGSFDNTLSGSGQSFLSQSRPKDVDLIVGSQSLNEDGTSNLYNNLGNTLNQPDEFQTIWAPIDLNNIPLTEIYTAPPMLFDETGNLMVQPDPKSDPAQLNPLGLFPRQIPTPGVASSASLEMAIGLNARNYYMGDAMVGHHFVAGGGVGNSTAQIQWNNSHQPNLALQL